MEHILYYLHFLIPLSIILMPLLPNKYLIYVFPYPIIYYIIWLVFDGCPITEISQKNMKDKKNFLFPLFQKYINKNITYTQVNYINHMVISLSIIISAYKLLYNCKTNCKTKCKK
jgi:hypothetical protein